MPKFKPRARIIRTIGDHLISGPEAAVIELVKNAYDADSPDALITIAPPSESTPTGMIVVADHGHGMSRHTITDVWMEPATTDKAERKTSPAGRRMLGNKGIGRFAVARLGFDLELQTTAAAADSRFERTAALIDWEWFNADQYLSDIDIPLETSVMAGDQQTGTTFRITRLRDEWTQVRLERLIRELRRVVTPQVAEETSFRIALDLSGFARQTHGFEGPALIAAHDELPLFADAQADDDFVTLRPYSLHRLGDYEVRGRFASNGEFIGAFTVARGDNKPTPLRLPPSASTEPGCGEVEVAFNIYDGEAESLRQLFARANINFERIGIRAARRILADQAGLSVYRHGFRIRPYGDPDFDWLELERKRVQDPSRRLGLSQVSGRIEITSEAESGLIERSSREGFERNAHFEALTAMLSDLFAHVEQRRFAFREKAGLSRKPQGDIGRLRLLAELSLVKRAVNDLPMRYRKDVLDAVDAESVQINKHLDALDDFQKMLQSRAAVGLVITEVLHEGRRLLGPLSSNARVLDTYTPKALEHSAEGDFARKHLVDSAKVIRVCSEGLGALFKRLDPLSGRKRGRPRSFLADGVLSDSLALLAEPIAEQGVRIEREGRSGIEVRGYPDDLQSALLNLIDNAIHWLGLVDPEKRRIKIVLRDGTDRITISVSNSGPQIPEEYWSRLFEPGFSLKAGGHGLGLAISREACRASGGELVYLPDADETTFLIGFPKPKSDQLAIP